MKELEDNTLDNPGTGLVCQSGGALVSREAGDGLFHRWGGLPPIGINRLVRQNLDDQGYLVVGWHLPIKLGAPVDHVFACAGYDAHGSIHRALPPGSLVAVDVSPLEDFDAQCVRYFGRRADETAFRRYKYFYRTAAE